MKCTLNVNMFADLYKLPRELHSSVNSEPECQVAADATLAHADQQNTRVLF